MILKSSKSSLSERAFVAFALTLGLALCMHSGNAFSSPSTARQLVGLASSMPTSVHLQYYHPFLNNQHHPLPSSSSSSVRRSINNNIPIYSSVSPNAESDDASSNQPPRSGLRSTLRAATGFSLTAFRATLRAATGISLSQSISNTLRAIVGMFHPSLRYFLQPFLIMYYAPLLMIRYYMVGPSREYVEESRRGHEKIVDGWRKAVTVAENANAGGYWPVHLNEDGTITTSLPPDPNDVLNLTDGIEQSVASICEKNNIEF